MKAWLVNEIGEFCAAVVFAETRGKAKQLAKSTECCEDTAFLDIEAHRFPKADKFYTPGATQLYWDEPEDRITLVKELGFTCDYDALYAGDCAECSAKEYCSQYKELSNTDER